MQPAVHDLAFYAVDKGPKSFVKAIVFGEEVRERVIQLLENFVVGGVFPGVRQLNPLEPYLFEQNRRKLRPAGELSLLSVASAPCPVFRGLVDLGFESADTLLE